MAEDDAYLVCMRVADLKVPVPGSHKKRCADCAQAVWVSPASLGLSKKKHLPLLCLACAAERAAKDDDVTIQPLTEEQKKEIRDAIERGVSTMVPSLRALLEGILDYAGLFPPARLPLGEAVRNYLRYRRDPDSWLLARFVCPVGRLTELAALLPDAEADEPPVPLAVLGRGGDAVHKFMASLNDDLEAVGVFQHRFSNRALTEAVEVREPERWLDQKKAGGVGPVVVPVLGSSLPLFWEIPFTAENWYPRLGTMLGVLRQGLPQLGFKLRCGGMAAHAMPSPGDVAYFIAACRDAEVPIKFTAGLHHPLRHFDPGLGARLHGFVNVFGAAVLAHARGLREEQLWPVLEDEDARNFVFDEQGFRWQDHHATTAEVVAARQWAVSFGSCSFDEPRDDLRALGWLS